MFFRIALYALSLSLAPSAGVTQIEFSGDSLNRACLDDGQAQFCRGVITTAGSILQNACHQGNSPDLPWPMAADLYGIEIRDLKDEFLSRMREAEFRFYWGEAPAQFAVMVAAIERWPCLKPAE
jgi:hypothetical protein